MSDSDTIDLRYTASKHIWKLLEEQQSTIIFIVLVLTLASLVYGVTSWCVLKKFRSYKNFVLLNTILSNFLLCSLTTIISFLPIELQTWLLMNGLFMYLSTYLTAARQYWLLILSHMFYVDFVKVSNGNIKRGFLKSCLFAWGFSFINTVVLICCHLYSTRLLKFFFAGCSMLPLIISCILYISIVYSLCRSFKISTHTSADIWRRLCKATLIFVLSDISFVSNYVVFIVPYNLRLKVAILAALYFYLISITLDVFLVLLKTNRELWHELNANKFNQESSEKQNLDIVKPELSV